MVLVGKNFYIFQPKKESLPRQPEMPFGIVNPRPQRDCPGQGLITQPRWRSGLSGIKSNASM